jgi:serine phosphatase RsbU (regulator of sigma subunit)
MSGLDQLYDALANASTHRSSGAGKRLVTHAGGLAQPIAPTAAELSNDQVMAVLAERPDVEVLPVVKGDVPVGLLNRSTFLEAYAKPFAREVFGRRPCTTWMDANPVVVDAAMPLEALVERAVASGPKVLRDGFITTADGRYAGLGTGHALMTAMSMLEAEKTRKLLESIDYASMIQRSHLRASDAELAAALPDHALAWEPRDVVGGDCYFFRRFDDGLFGAVLDCTGHGVPGAFMTLIALSFLDHWVGSASRDPGAALEALNRHIKRVLGQDGRGAVPIADPARRSDDGLDGACFWLPASRTQIAFAGAYLPLLVAAPGATAAEVFAGERVSVGYDDTPPDQRWPARLIPLPPGALVAIATDGLSDQVGGFKHIALGRKRLTEVLAASQGRPAPAVRDRIMETLLAWQAGEPRRDDVTLLLFTAGGAA